MIAELPIMTAKMTCDDHLMIVTGSNMEGTPLILGLDFNGKVLWEFLFLNITPITWPEAACRPIPVIAWQEIPGKIEIGLLDTQENLLLPKLSFAVDAPPAKIFSWKTNIWAAWAEKGKIKIIDLAGDSRKEVITGETHIGEFSFGQSSDGNYLGWNKGNQAFWLLPNKASPISAELEEGTMGKIKVISGGLPLMWIQNSKQGIDENLESESILILPGARPYNLDEFIFSVAWWQQRVAVVRQSAVLLLKKAD